MTMLANLANVAHALRVPRLWPCLPIVARSLVEPWAPTGDALERAGLLARQRRYTLRVVGQLGDGGRPEGRSPLPALALCLGALASAGADDEPNGAPSEVSDLRGALLTAAASAAPMEPGDCATLHDLIKGWSAADPVLSRARAWVAAHRPDSPLGPVLRDLAQTRSSA
jgi:hypothetical protein